MVQQAVNPPSFSTLGFPFSKLFDHTLLKAYASRADLERLCSECRQYGFAMAAINPAQVSLCRELLEGSGVHVGAAVSFPLGQTTIRQKAFETASAIEDGADEIDYVVNISRLKDRDYAYLEREMEEIVRLCRQAGRISKVIFENCYLTKEEIVQLCHIASRVGPDFIKTSTGFGTGGATFEDVALMRQNADPRIRIKAAGGVRELDTALKMVELGATRIGTSAGVSIMEAFRARFPDGQ